MRNTAAEFYGRQTGERILYVVRPHWIHFILQFIKFTLVSMLIIFSFWLVENQLASLAAKINLTFIGLMLAMVIVSVGAWVVANAGAKNTSYITDRRVVKFEAATPLATSIRSLSWEEAVKVKTFPQNFLFKQLKIGSVVVHAKTTISSTDVSKSENIVTDDDIELADVYYYRDLGNYIEKILFLYKKQPKEVVNLNAFVPKPKGKRG